MSHCSVSHHVRYCHACQEGGISDSRESLIEPDEITRNSIVFTPTNLSDVYSSVTDPDSPPSVKSDEATGHSLKPPDAAKSKVGCLFSTGTIMQFSLA